jgi:hypothetical protein
VLNDIPALRPDQLVGSERISTTAFDALSPGVQASLRRFFGFVGGWPLANYEVARIRNVFQRVATAIDTQTLRFECTDADEGGLASWVKWYPIRGWTPVMLPPAFWANGPRRQVAIIFHELSHIYAGTEDHGYIVGGSWTRGVAND